MSSQFHSYENTPDEQTSVPFIYPDMHQLPPDILQAIDEYTTELTHAKITAAIRRLIILLEGQRNPVLTLNALLLSQGIFDTNGNGTKQRVANQLGISRQRLNYHVKTMPKRLQKEAKRLHKERDNSPYTA